MSWSLGAILEDDKKCHLTKRHMIMFFSLGTNVSGPMVCYLLPFLCKKVG